MGSGSPAGPQRSGGRKRPVSSTRIQLGCSSGCCSEGKGFEFSLLLSPLPPLALPSSLADSNDQKSGQEMLSLTGSEFQSRVQFPLFAVVPCAGRDMCLGLSNANSVFIDSPTGMYVLNAHPTCQMKSTRRNHWWQSKFFRDVQADFLRVQITARSQDSELLLTPRSLGSRSV